jgi:neutral ceramidase
MVMGRRTANSIKNVVEPELSRVILVGLSNEYLSYFTTPEEYEAQHYEGASTLYGPASGPLVAYKLRSLVEEFATRPPDGEPRDFSYRPGSQRSFGLHDVGTPPYFFDDGLANVLQDLDTGHPIRNFPHYCWKDKIPILPVGGDKSAGVIPRIAIERKDVAGNWVPLLIGGIEETDQGLDFVTVVVEAGDETLKWCSFWMPPPKVDRPLTFRFCVDPPRGRSICSELFTLKED